MGKYRLKMNPLKCVFDVHSCDFLGSMVHKKMHRNKHICVCRWLFRLRGTQKKHRNKPEQDEGYIQYTVSVEQDITSVPISEDKFLKEVHFKPKWQDKSVFTFATIEERRGTQMGTKTYQGFWWDQDVPVDTSS